MRLTRSEHGDQVDRFAHLEKARRLRGESRCGEELQGVVKACTRPVGHRGPHVAHGRGSKVLAVWEADASASRPRGEGERSGPGVPMRPGERSLDAPGPLGRMWGAILRALSSPEALALIVLFLGMVAFAVDVARRILLPR